MVVARLRHRASATLASAALLGGARRPMVDVYVTRHGGNRPACAGVSRQLFRADGYARSAGARLPTEFDCGAGAREVTPDGTFVDSGVLRPLPSARLAHGIAA